MLKKCNNKCSNKSNCGKHQNCSCKCNCQNNMEEIYLFLGKYVYNLLNELELPCGHPSLKCSLEMLMKGEKLPCGHPSLEELIALAIKKDQKCNCNCKCNCDNQCYSKHDGCKCR